MEECAWYYCFIKFVVESGITQLRVWLFLPLLYSIFYKYISKQTVRSSRCSTFEGFFGADTRMFSSVDPFDVFWASKKNSQRNLKNHHNDDEYDDIEDFRDHWLEWFRSQQKSYLEQNLLCRPPESFESLNSINPRRNPTKSTLNCNMDVFIERNAFISQHIEIRRRLYMFVEQHYQINWKIRTRFGSSSHVGNTSL